MSISTFLSHLFGGSPHIAVSAASKQTTAAVKAFGSSEAAKVIAALSTTDIGAAVKADVLTMQNASLSGAEKFAQVVSNTVPLVLKFVTGGGIAAVEADVLSITQGLVQTVYLDTASTTFGKIVGEFARLLGI